MPNHVKNSLQFKGFSTDEIFSEQIEKIKHFIGFDEIEITYIDFKKIHPVPDGLADPNPVILSDDERQWRIQNWGTKWIAYKQSFFQKEDKLIIEFKTAWSEPNGIMEKIGEFLTKIKFQGWMQMVSTCEGGLFAAYTRWQDSELFTKVWEDRAEVEALRFAQLLK